VLGFFPGGKVAGLGADHSPSSSAEVKNEGSYTSILTTTILTVLYDKITH
jgi:hypothetical protein